MFGLFSIANIPGLLLALAMPLLIFAYLRRRSSKRRLVSSLLLLQQIESRKTSRRKIKFPFRFFWELFILALLVLAIAKPFIKNTAEHIAVLIDNSLSMHARQKDGTSRLDSARELLIKRLDNLPGNTRYTLFSTSPALSRIAQKDLSKNELISYLKTLRPFPASDELETYAKQLLSSQIYDRLMVASDRSLLQTTDKHLESQVELIGNVEPRDNLYISALQIAPEKTSEELTIIATVSASLAANDSIQSKVSLATFSLGDSKSKANIIDSKTVTLNKGFDTPVSFRVSKEQANGKGFKIFLDVNPFEDALLEDNTAWAVFSNKSATGNLLVTPSSAPSGLERIPDRSFKVLSPKDYLELTEKELESFFTIIFYQATPTELPPVPSLFILPPSENILFPVKTESKQLAISSWDSTHPLTTYLRVPVIKPKRGLIFDNLSWTQSVINATEGSILLAGERNGNRYAAIGMELLPFEGRKSPALSVLTLNLLNWLNRSQRQLQNFYTSGQIVRFPGSNTWKLKSPNNLNLPVQKKVLFSSTEPLAEAGIYNAQELPPGNKKMYFAVNVFVPAESDTASLQPFVLDSLKSSEPSTIQHTFKSELWTNILVLACLMLFLESIALTFFKQKEEL